MAPVSRVSRFVDGVRNSLWFSAALTLVLLGAGLWALYEFVPYMWLFLFTNFVFIYVAVFYMLKYWEEKPEKLSDRFPPLTVIVSAYNEEDKIGACLKTVKAMKYPRPIEILVVDDASKDGTYAKLKKIAGIKVIRNARNIGKGASLNMAIKRSKGELIATVDADSYPAPDALMKMVPHFNSERVGAVIALVCAHKPKNLLERVQEIEYFVSFGFWHTAFAKMDALLVTPGPLSVYSKKALVKIGGFEPGNITEDMEIALHLQDAGYRICCNTDAKIYTDVPSTLGAWYRQRLRWLRGKIYNGFKYHHMIFDSEHGDFGRFVYPVSFLVEALGVVFVLRLLLLHGSNLFSMVAGAVGVANVNAAILYDPNFYAAVATINSSLFFFAFAILLWSYVTWISFKIARQKLSLLHLLPLAVYLTFYSMFISMVYFSSAVHEFVGTRRDW